MSAPNRVGKAVGGLLVVERVAWLRHLVAMQPGRAAALERKAGLIARYRGFDGDVWPRCDFASLYPADFGLVPLARLTEVREALPCDNSCADR